MSDNIQILPPVEKKKPRKRWLIFLAVTLVVLLALVLLLLTQSTLLDSIKRSVDQLWVDVNTVMSFDAYGDCSYSLLNDGLTVASPGGIFLFSNQGEQLGNIPRSMTSPISICRNQRLFVCDIGGSNALVIDASGSTLQELQASTEILDGDLSDSGSCCLLTGGDDCRAMAEVYHTDGSLLFRRISKTEHLNTCAISPDGSTLVLTALGQENIAFTSTAQIFSVSQEKMQAELPLGNQVIYDMAFLNDTTICAVGEDSVIFFHPDGTRLSEYSYESLTDFCFTGEGFVALTVELSQSDERHQLLLLDGSNTISQVLPAAPLQLSCAGRYVSVLTAGQLLIYDHSGVLRTTLDTVGSFGTALVRKDGSAILIEANKARFYIP